MDAFAQRADVRVIVHDHAARPFFAQECGQIEVVPSADVSRKVHALQIEVHRSAKSDAATMCRISWATIMRASGFARSSRSLPPSGQSRGIPQPDQFVFFEQRHRNFVPPISIAMVSCLCQ